MTVQQFLVQNVGSSTSAEEVGRVVEGARRITSTVSSIMSSPNIISTSSIDPPTPPVEAEQEVVVTPVTPSPTDGTPTTGEISNTIPQFSATPSGDAMHNKVKVLGFVR